MGDRGVIGVGFALVLIKEGNFKVLDRFLNFLMAEPHESWLLELLKVLPSALVALLIGFGTLRIARNQYLLAKKDKDLSADARYLAIRIVCILDPYVDDCASVVADSGSEDQEGVNTPDVKEPDPPQYPADVNWKSIDSNLMFRILSLPVAAERAASYVQASLEHSFPPDHSEWFEERTRQYGPLGLQAHRLSQDLKKLYGVSLEVADHPYWNPVETLQLEIDKLKKREEERALKNASILDEVGLVPRAEASLTGDN